jgi:hypothetical protein
MSGTNAKATNGIFAQYDEPAISPDLPGEVAAAASSPIEVSNFYSLVTMPGGIRIAEPIWLLDDLVPYIQANLTTTGSYGAQYDYLPDSLSKDLYGAHDLWPLLMALNGVSAREDFVGPTFVVLRTAAAATLRQAFALAAKRAAADTAAAAPAADLTLIPVPYLGQ